MSKDELKVVSGGADSVITIWDDITEEENALKQASDAELILKY